MNDFISDLSQNVRFVDVIDIGIVAVLIYGLTSWGRERAWRSFLLPLIGVLAVYWLAVGLELYLTTMVFQYGVIGAVFAFVLIFQQDIRRGFEHIATWQWSRPADTQPSQDAVAVIAQSVDHLAQHKIGALLVFPGREEIERHVRGGIAVDACISMPLLCSIFHAKSPGHDGAVIMRGNRVAQLGVHLPLTGEVSRVPHGGTRHAAALGLADCCDALVIAVSEERGTITLARDGQLAEISSEELVTALGRHYQDHVRDDAAASAGWLQRGGRKIAAIVIASILWFQLAHQTETIQRTVVVPIEYRGLPEQFIVDDPAATTTEVTLRGSVQAFGNFDATKVTVSIALDSAVAGRRSVTMARDNLRNLSSDLEVVRIEPQQIYLTVKPSQPVVPQPQQ